jgi:hypothetical protein
MQREHPKYQRLIEPCRSLPAVARTLAALAAHARRESAAKAVS